jgi:hypothetical protein
LGLQDASEYGVDLGLQVALGEERGLHGWVGADRIKAVIDSQQDFSAPWQSRTEDEFLGWGFGAHTRISTRWIARLDGYGGRSTGRIDTDDRPFPDLETDLRHLAVWLEFDAGEHWDWKFSAEHERYEATDWQQDGLAPDSIPAVLTMGLDNPDGSVTVLRVLGSYQF